MKKLLYLFLAITIISCGGDDDSNGTNEPQTFLEKYDGIVWIGDESTADDSYFLAVYNQPEKLYYWETDLDGEYCFPVTFGQPDEFGDVVTIIENTSNNLILTVTTNAGEENNIRLTAGNEGSNLTVEWIYETGLNDTETYSRSSSANPCL